MNDLLYIFCVIDRPLQLKINILNVAAYDVCNKLRSSSIFGCHVNTSYQVLLLTKQMFTCILILKFLCRKSNLNKLGRVSGKCQGNLKFGKCQGTFYFWKCQGNVRELFFGWLITYKISKTTRKSDKTT